MTEKNTSLPRPLTAEELKAKAAEFDRDGQPHTVEIALDVTGSRPPDPKTSVQSEGDI